MEKIKHQSTYKNLQNFHLLVKKFGGTSVASIERIEAVADRLIQDKSRGEFPIVVLSAMSGQTNRLIDLAQEVYPDYRGEAYDMLLATGEQISISLLAMALNKRGHKAKPLLAFQLGVQTNWDSSNARIQNIQIQKLLDLIDQEVIPIVAGFQGMTEQNIITTLGRGGSDTSAVALAAALNLPECEIYTDVPKVFSADPRLVKKAAEIDCLSYEEMMEMSSLGSRVLHTRAIEIAAKHEVRIHVRSSFEHRSGTWILPEGETIMEQPVVSGITHEPGMWIVGLYPLPKSETFLSEVFTALANEAVVVDIITQHQGERGPRLSFSIKGEDKSTTQQVLKDFKEQFGLEISFLGNVSRVSVVGMGMKNHPGVAAQFFKVFGDYKIPIHLITTSEIQIGAVINDSDLIKAAEILHHEFRLDKSSG